tara:strand:- start:1896 stop:2033 length:138 start_codon:yes stop_codon:yes gene_type:complete
MKIKKEFYTQADAWEWVKNQKQPKRGDYFIERDFMTGMFVVWLMD